MNRKTGCFVERQAARFSVAEKYVAWKMSAQAWTTVELFAYVLRSLDMALQKEYA